MIKALRFNTTLPSVSTQAVPDTIPTTGFELEKNAEKSISSFFAHIKQTFDLERRMVILAVLAKISTNTFDRPSRVISNLNRIISACNDGVIVESLQYLLGLSIIKNVNKYDKRQYLKNYKFASSEIEQLICSHLNNDLDAQKYSAVKSIIETSTNSDIWINLPCAYLAKSQLEGLISEYKNLLYLNVMEKRFLLESAIYNESNLIVFFAESFTLKNSFTVINRFMFSENKLLRLRAAQAIQKLIGKFVGNQKLGDLLYAKAMNDKSASVRYQCSVALTKLYRSAHIELIKHETRNIHFGLRQLLFHVLSLIYSLFLYKPKDIFRSVSKEDRALDILAIFFSLKIDLSDFRRAVRKKASILWRRRQIINERRHLVDWMFQGRLIGLSAALAWFVSTGLLLILTLKNIHFSNSRFSPSMSIIAISVLLTAVVTIGIFWGRSISKTTFVRHILYKDHTWYKYVLHNPLYKMVLVILTTATLFLTWDYKNYTTAFSIFGLLSLWLMTPILFHLFNSIRPFHSATIRGKSFVGSLIIFVFAFITGNALTIKYNDLQFLYFFLCFGSITSIVFMAIYFSSNMSIKQHSTKDNQHSCDKVWRYAPPAVDALLFILSVFLTGALLVNAYGLEALTGKAYSKPLSNDSNSTLHYVIDNNEYGPEDVNYYRFEASKDQLALLTVPSMSSSAQKQDAILVFDKFEEVDFSYFFGESYLLPPGTHFVTARSKADYKAKQKPLSFSFNLERIPKFLPSAIKAATNTKAIKNLTTAQFSIGNIKWEKSTNGKYWTSTISGVTDTATSNYKLRILTSIYTDKIKKSANAVIYTTHPDQAKSHIPTYIQKTDRITHVPMDDFYSAKLDDVVLKTNGNKWTLNLYLVSPDLETTHDSFETVAFIDVSVASSRTRKALTTINTW